MARRSAQTNYSIIALGVTALIGFALYWFLNLDMYWVWLIAINLVTFLLYRYDKGRAQVAGAGRVPEIVLLSCTVLGGAVGAAGGMYLRPRHKTQKPVFVLTLLVAAAVHLWLLLQFFL